MFNINKALIDILSLISRLNFLKIHNDLTWLSLLGGGAPRNKMAYGGDGQGEDD